MSWRTGGLVAGLHGRGRLLGGLRERLVTDKPAFDSIVAVATCRDSWGFADLCWSPFDLAEVLQLSAEGRVPGVIFETATRVVVIEEHGGELRYYAGGWSSPESHIHVEDERIWAEGLEMGVLPSPCEAVRFAERFLARGQPLQEIETPRIVHQREDTVV
jgi:hypothetical protein